MQPVSPEELDGLAPEWDARVEGDAQIDSFCSRSAWQLACHAAFAPDRSLWFGQRGDAVVVLAERPGGMLEALENSWGFAAPLVGEGAGELLAQWLLVRPRTAVLPGLPLARDRLVKLLEPLAEAFFIRGLPTTTRFVASLAGGVEGWLARRRPSFRRNLRASLRRAGAEGIDFRWVDEAAGPDLEALYATVLDVESRSWKGREGSGAGSGPMRDFYADLWPRLARRGQLRVLLAEREGRAVGYLHGARVGDHFRGLQLSFDHALARLGLGNVLQFRALERLAAAGVQTYDLGSYSEYKRGWGEEGLQTLALVLQPRGPG